MRLERPDTRHLEVGIHQERRILRQGHDLLDRLLEALRELRAADPAGSETPLDADEALVMLRAVQLLSVRLDSSLLLAVEVLDRVAGLWTLALLLLASGVVLNLVGAALLVLALVR